MKGRVLSSGLSVSPEVSALGRSYRNANLALHAALRLEILNDAVEVTMKSNQTAQGLALLKEPLLMPHRPAFYVLRSTEKECMLVTYLPDAIGVKERMLYAASQSVLHEHFGSVLTRDIHCSSIEDVQMQMRDAATTVDRRAFMSAVELQKDQVLHEEEMARKEAVKKLAKHFDGVRLPGFSRQMSFIMRKSKRDDDICSHDGTEKTTVAARSGGFQPIACALTDCAKTALRSIFNDELKAHATRAAQPVVVNKWMEFVLMPDHCTVDYVVTKAVAVEQSSPTSAQKQLPAHQEEPRFYYYTIHDQPKLLRAFVYFCPVKASPRMKMLYSSAKTSFVTAIHQTLIDKRDKTIVPIDFKVDIFDHEDLNHQHVVSEYTTPIESPPELPARRMSHLDMPRPTIAQRGVKLPFGLGLGLKRQPPSTFASNGSSPKGKGLTTLLNKFDKPSMPKQRRPTSQFSKRPVEQCTVEHGERRLSAFFESSSASESGGGGHVVTSGETRTTVDDCANAILADLAGGHSPLDADGFKNAPLGFMPIIKQDNVLSNADAEIEVPVSGDNELTVRQDSAVELDTTTNHVSFDSVHITPSSPEKEPVDVSENSTDDLSLEKEPVDISENDDALTNSIDVVDVPEKEPVDGSEKDDAPASSIDVVDVPEKEPVSEEDAPTLIDVDVLEKDDAPTETINDDARPLLLDSDGIRPISTFTMLSAVPSDDDDFVNVHTPVSPRTTTDAVTDIDNGSLSDASFVTVPSAHYASQRSSVCSLVAEPTP